jgi:TRAP-type mannitol/chloroaromatic compound transport system substrate-binding protein
MQDRSKRALITHLAAGAVASVGAPAIAAAPAVRWRLASSFPKNLETIYGGAELLAERVRQLTSGRMQIVVSPAGELAPALKVLSAVQDGTVECGHSASYYYVDRNKAFAFDCALPFGMTTRQQNAWVYYGGGNELLRRLFAEHGIVNFPGGNTATQMGGWFRNEIASLADLKGLKMRIPGIGGEIMSRLGVMPVSIPGGDIHRALAKREIDAAEWIGPHDDEKLGLHKLVKRYYYPGWWEPETQLSFYVNAREWARLPKDYQEAFTSACNEVNLKMVANYDVLNPRALVTLVARGVKLHRFPQDVMLAAHKAAFELYEEEAERNATFGRIYSEWARFRLAVQRWHGLAEHTLETFMYSSGTTASQR